MDVYTKYKQKTHRVNNVYTCKFIDRYPGCIPVHLGKSINTHRTRVPLPAPPPIIVTRCYGYEKHSSHQRVFFLWSFLCHKITHKRTLTRSKQPLNQGAT